MIIIYIELFISVYKYLDKLIINIHSHGNEINYLRYSRNLIDFFSKDQTMQGN